MEKYKFLLDLKLMNIGINESLILCGKNKICSMILKDKLDFVCNFILDNSNNIKWNKYVFEENNLIAELRESTIRALGYVEKYQANSILEGDDNTFKYSEDLKLAVQKDILEFDINNKSKILFIGSGAMPITAFTINNEVGAEIVCLDIDKEALQLSQKLCNKYCIKNIYFLSKDIKEIDLNKFTHIIIASLVDTKLDIAKYLLKNTSRNTKIILRYGNRLKSIFNYPLDVRVIKNCQKTIIKDNSFIYESIMLEKDYE